VVVLPAPGSASLFARRTIYWRPWINSFRTPNRLIWCGTACPPGTHVRLAPVALGIAPDGLLRCCVLKHLKGWSFRDPERELRSNLVYRRFTHFDAEATHDYSSFSRLFALLGSSITEKIHGRVVGLAQEQGIAQGRKLRTDTTVVESNIQYPTDSTLLDDGIRVHWAFPWSSRPQRSSP
jgi:IS5 family transposase